MGGLIAFPTLAMYHASKWALEGFSESLAQEVTEFGIKVTLIEPGGYATDWGGSSAAYTHPLPAYDGIRIATARFMGAYPLGDPEATGEAILAVVDAEPPPLRVFFGGPPLQMVQEVYHQRLASWEEWQSLSKSAQGS
jgi:NAD(P)-dependent dehydrogenase (short-subunit alcohol dehydrogenase family)